MRGVKCKSCKNNNDFIQNKLNIHPTLVSHYYEIRMQFRRVSKWKPAADARSRFSCRYIKARTRRVVRNRRAPSIMHYSNKDRTQLCLVSVSSSLLHRDVGRLLKTAEFRVVFVFTSRRFHGPRCCSTKIPSGRPRISAKTCSTDPSTGTDRARSVSAVAPPAQGFCAEICGR